MRIEHIRDAVLLLTVAAYSAGLATPGLVVILVVLVVEVASRSWRWVPTALDVPLVGLALAVLGSVIFSEWRGAILDEATYFFLTLLVSIRTVATYVRGGIDRVVRLLLVWIAGGVAAAAWGLTRFRPAILDSAATAAIGQNALGTTLAVATILALGLVMGGGLRSRWWPAAGLPILLAGLVVTWARAAWLGAALGLVTLALVGSHTRARIALTAACVVVIGLGGAVLPRWPALRAEVRSIGSLQANRNRIVLWRTAPKMVADHLLLGTGFGTFSLAYPRYRPPDAPEPNAPFAHNIFLNFAVETGLPGLAAITGLYITGLAAAWRWLARSPPASPDRAASTAVLAASVTMLANQLLDGTAMSIHVGFGFFALLALGAAGDRYLAAPTPSGVTRPPDPPRDIGRAPSRASA